MFRRRPPLLVTFDTNTYSCIANPQPRRLLEKWWPLSRARLQSKGRRIAWWYLNCCIRKGRIVAGIPEALVATEALQKIDRIDLLLAVGTKALRPTVPPARLTIIRKAVDIGFRIMRMPRIGHPPLYQVAPDEWAADQRFSQEDRLDRSHGFGRYFGDYAHLAVRDCGEKLSKLHGLSTQAASFASKYSGESPERHLWREGLAAERDAQKLYPTRKQYDDVVRKLLADWTDFDVAAAHYGY